MSLTVGWISIYRHAVGGEGYSSLSSHLHPIFPQSDLTQQSRRYDFTMCLFSSSTRSMLNAEDLLELIIYSQASQAGIKVSGNLLLRHFSWVTRSVSVGHVAALMNSIWWAALKSPALPFSAQIYRKTGRHNCCLHTCQSISLFYRWLGQRPRGLLISKDT